MGEDDAGGRRLAGHPLDWSGRRRGWRRVELRNPDPAQERPARDADVPGGFPDVALRELRTKAADVIGVVSREKRDFRDP